MGWFETARRATMADRISEGLPATATTTVRGPERGAGQAGPGRGGGGPGRGGSGRPADVDDSDDQLAAYNAYLARINSPVSHNSETSE
jgi:hypothetical protein